MSTLFTLFTLPTIFPPDSATIAMLTDLWALATKHPTCIILMLASIPILLTNLTILCSLASLYFSSSSSSTTTTTTSTTTPASPLPKPAPALALALDDDAYNEDTICTYTTYATLLLEWTACLLLGFTLGVPPTLLASCAQDWGMYFIKQYVGPDMQTAAAIVFSVVFYMGVVTWLGVCWANVARTRDVTVDGYRGIGGWGWEVDVEGGTGIAGMKSGRWWVEEEKREREKDALPPYKEKEEGRW
ncbi:hypothetical protein K491DRAFT_675008 [Lophiostoma macrostomum CBS 122681]|uniref:Uncharacterized protein n=1 Tax=Lophiostoma macrostomum CBS 122681 TaxID=1314788 RepID=A0A6A6TJM6_9PLEO|nr:hypothetical protein K491DRAFT_675008 [Lophiostoma macrostomum CBS 122681]